MTDGWSRGCEGAVIDLTRPGEVVVDMLVRHIEIDATCTGGGMISIIARGRTTMVVRSIESIPGEEEIDAARRGDWNVMGEDHSALTKGMTLVVAPLVNRPGAVSNL